MAKLTEKARRLAHRLPDGRSSAPLVGRPRRPPFIPAKAVGSFVPRLTQKSFEKFGFSAATLLTDWAAIVGSGLARDTVPERLKWPRAIGVDAGNDGATGRPGATLVLRVDPARALDIEYKRAQILDRINGYFGYRAVSEIRIVQEAIRPLAPSTRHVAAAPDPHRAGPSSARPDMSHVADDALRAALERLHAGVSARARAL